MQASAQSTILPMESLIPGCVEESLHISFELQMDLIINKHMMHMLMEFQSHLVTQEDILGHLQQQLKININVPVLWKEMMHLYLLMRTTFVKSEYKVMVFLMAIHSGMVKTVLASVPAVNSTTLHGSVSS